jgi:hypothetical protein
MVMDGWLWMVMDVMMDVVVMYVVVMDVVMVMVVMVMVVMVMVVMVMFVTVMVVTVMDGDGGIAGITGCGKCMVSNTMFVCGVTLCYYKTNVALKIFT